jgi:hypothetical protein
MYVSLEVGQRMLSGKRSYINTWVYIAMDIKVRRIPGRIWVI